MSAWCIPAGEGRVAIEAKRSRFIASAAHAATREQAEHFIACIRQEFSDATHNAFAFVTGQPGRNGEIACSDDGEVSGTAGRPILSVLQHAQFAETVLVVTRYYGGSLLGTGGLQRAYSQAAKDLLAQIPRLPYQRWVPLMLHCDYAAEADVRHLLHSHGAELQAIHYQTDVQVMLRVPEPQQAALSAALLALGRGRFSLREIPPQAEP